MNEPAYPVADMIAHQGLSKLELTAKDIFCALVSNSNVLGYSHDAGWAFVNCTSGQLAQFSALLASELLNATKDKQAALEKEQVRT